MFEFHITPEVLPARLHFTELDFVILLNFFINKEKLKNVKMSSSKFKKLTTKK